MKKIFAIYFIVFSFLEITAQKAVIPFTINEYNRIILHYPIKNNMLNLVFDSGATINVLDSALARKLDFAVANNSKIALISTSANVNFRATIPIGKQMFKQDSIFWGSWLNSNMKETSAMLTLGKYVDGIVGYYNDYILELDFKKNKLLIWDSLPSKYFESSKPAQVKLVDSNYGVVTSKRYGAHSLCMKTEMTFLDTLNLYPNMIIDTGNPLYLCLEVFESSLFNKLVEFRRTKAESQKTISLRIPELEIDTSFHKTYTVSHLEKNAANPYRSAVGGLLGVSFLRRYKRVILDRKNQIAWFER